MLTGQAEELNCELDKITWTVIYFGETVVRMNGEAPEKMIGIYDVVILLAGMMWGILGIFVNRLTGMGFSSVQVAGLRWISSACIVFALVFVTDKDKLRIRLRDIWIFALIGVGSSLAMSMFYFLSMNLTSVAVSDVLLYTSPVWVLIFSVIFFHERITIKKVCCILLAVCGCALVCGILEQSGGRWSAKGIAFGVCSGIAYSLYSIMGKVVLKKYDRITLLVYNVLFAALGALFIVDIPQTATLIQNNVYSLVFILLLATVGTLFPFFLYTVGLKKTVASKAAVICCIEPVMAAAVSALVLKEPLGILQMIGIGLIIGSIVLLQIKDEKRKIGVQNSGE